MKLNQKQLRELILKEMSDMSYYHGSGRGGPTYTQGEREGYDDYKGDTAAILDGLYAALTAASVYPGHEDIRAVIESCLRRVESLVVV